MAPQLNILYRKIAIAYLICVIFIYLIFCTYYIVNDISPLSHISVVLMLTHIAWLLVIYAYKNIEIVSILPFYFIFFMFSKYPDLLIFWKNGAITVFFWYMILPCATLLYKNYIHTIIWSSATIVLLVSVFFITPHISFGSNFSEDMVSTINIITIITSFMLITFFVIIVNMIMKKTAETASENAKNEKLQLKDVEKYTLLYQKIVDVMEQDKPYRNLNFTILDLAKAMDSNPKYIYKALTTAGNKNFNAFINQYRINYVKERLRNNAVEKRTMANIYTKAGFRNQSTFNKVFKDMEGISPQNYVKQFEKAASTPLDSNTEQKIGQA